VNTKTFSGVIFLLGGRGDYVLESFHVGFSHGRREFSMVGVLEFPGLFRKGPEIE
jgi:hypothetical protein